MSQRTRSDAATTILLGATSKLSRDELRIVLEGLSKSEDDAQRRLAELDTIYDSAPVGLCVLDTGLRYVRINTRLAEINGRAAAEHIGRTVREMIPNVADQLEPGMRRVLETGEPVLGTEIVGDTVPPRVWIESWYPLRDATGTIVGLNVVAEDVTEMKRVEEMLRQREAELERIIELSHVGIVVASMDGRAVEVNDAFCGIVGYTREELLGADLTWQSLTPAEYHPFDLAAIGALRRGDVPEPFEKEYVRKDGVRVPVLIGGGLLPGPTLRAVVFVVDLSARKWAENALRTSDRRASFLAAASHVLSESLDVRDILSAIGQLAVPRLADWCLVETFGTDFSPDHVVIKHRDPDKAAQAMEATRRYTPERNPAHPLARVIQTGRSELLADIPDALLGTIAQEPTHLAWLRSLAVRSAVIAPMQARGRTLGVLALATAESGRRYEEGDLALAEELARRAALAVDNARLYSELREQGRRKDEFLAMLAHELRNSLAPILNAVTVLDRAGAQTSEAVPLRSIITRQTRHLGRLVDDLLDVARLASGKIHLQRQRLDVRDVVRRSIEALRQAGRVQGHALTISLPDDPAVVDGDPGRLEQVVWNLLDNAVKYTPAGRAIRVCVALEAQTCLVSVHDEGVGIAPQLLSRLFEPFVQGERSAARPQGGLGLGLALVRALVEQHGGSVTAQSAGVGGGTEFIVRLPLASSTDEDIPHETPRAVPRPLRIVVIEDNDDARAALRALLESDGHSVETAADGGEGLRVASATSPEVVIIDIGLPVVDGYEVARRLRASEATRSARLIALTGYGQPEDRRRSEQAGFDAHLVKPVDDKQLAHALAAVR